MNQALSWLLPGSVVALVLAVIVVSFAQFIRIQRRTNDAARVAQARLDFNLQRHDRTARALTAEAFDRHKRTCPRCRGDAFGHFTISTEQLTVFRP